MDRKKPPIFFVLITGMILWILVDAVYFGILEQSRSLPETMYLTFFSLAAAIVLVLGIVFLVVRGVLSRRRRDEE